MSIRDMWDFSNPAASEQRFREAADKCVDPLLQAEYMTQVARALGLQRKFQDGLVTLSDVRFTLPYEPSKAKIRLELETGRILNSSGRREEALPYFHKAAEIAFAMSEDDLEIDAVHMLGIADQAERQLDWNLLAIEKAENTEDPEARKWLASLYNNTGWSLFELDRFEEALQLFLKAIPLREAAGKAEPLRIAHWSVARVLRAQGKPDEAIRIQRTLFSQDPTGGYINEELAYLLADSDPEQSKLHAKNARDALSKDPWFVENESSRLDALNRMAAR